MFLIVNFCHMAQIYFRCISFEIHILFRHSKNHILSNDNVSFSFKSNVPAIRSINNHQIFLYISPYSDVRCTKIFDISASDRICADALSK